MIIVTRPGTTQAEIDQLRERIEGLGLRTHISRGEFRTIIGCIGDEAALRQIPFHTFPAVESATPVLKPYKLASREFAAGSTVVRIGEHAEVSVGGEAVIVAAGPCSVEGPDMLRETALAVRQAGAQLLRVARSSLGRLPTPFRGWAKTLSRCSLTFARRRDCRWLPR